MLWDDLSHAEAAAVLGCSVNAVEFRFRRAQARVRDALAVAVDRPDLSPRPPQPAMEEPAMNLDELIREINPVPFASAPGPESTKQGRVRSAF